MKETVKTALSMIEDGMTVSLGGGNTVAALAEAIAKSGKKIQVITPSIDTKLLCGQYGIPLFDFSCPDPVSIAFDGCDELDENLNALKSCGAIHTREKIAASLADSYVLFASEAKIAKDLKWKHPLTLEVLPCALSLVHKKIEELGGRTEPRKAQAKSGLVISDDGNLIVDAWFEQKPDLAPRELAAFLDQIPGLVGHALFAGIAAKAIVETEDGQARIVEADTDYRNTDDRKRRIDAYVERKTELGTCRNRMDRA